MSAEPPCPDPPADSSPPASRWTSLRVGLLLLVLGGACVLGGLLARPWLESAWRGQESIGQVLIQDDLGVSRLVLVFAEPAVPSAPTVPPPGQREVRFWVRSGVLWRSAAVAFSSKPIEITSRPDVAKSGQGSMGELYTPAGGGVVFFKVQDNEVVVLHTKYGR